ncbi:HD domain-containing protein [Candidatus Bipolaricaulota bacterium]|nr:HD domain-containing protein [Candidatus Bipolaricaulota bacterium]
MSDEIRMVLPEVDWIEDEGLREAVIRTYSRALEQTKWTPKDLSKMPFTLVKETDISYIDHVRAVTRISHAVYGVFKDLFGERLPLNRDVLLAGALLHDVGKLLEVEERDGKYLKSAGGKLLRHPFSGVALAAAEGVPPEVLHVIAVHSKEGDPYPRTPEGVIVHHADFICFDTIKG